MKLLDDGRFNKVANVVGHTMQFHPHGDASIGDALVQLGQKDLLIECQGNWGNILTGDSAAAPRYIEARLSKFALDVVFNPKTTEWKLSYDGRKKEPVTLPVKFPLLLAQGVEGIAVGLASKILPHNFNEILQAAVAYLRGEEFHLYPDFQTGGFIDVSKYNDGERGGSVKVRAKIEKIDNRTLSIVEIPYGKTTSTLIESILKAQDKGKIKIRKVDDNTAQHAEILVHLIPGTSSDKAIDALDEAGSRVHLTNITVPKEIEEQEKLIEEARQQKADAVKSQNFELAASFRDHEKEFSARLEEMKAEWEARLKDDRQIVGEEEIANVVSMMSGVPVQRMAQAEGIKLAGMKEELQAKVIAQDPAIEKVTKAILRSRVGLKDPNRPIGTFLFLGPTGVGKTHLAKQLAKYMFGSADALIRVDMSEYMEKFTVSRLVGAPPGYVGYEEGGQLTEKVRRKPYSIVLLDEIEKAHPDVFNILLQLMDEGRLTDSYGRTVDFKNTVVIMTSNIGTRQLKDFGRGVGFAAQNRTDDKEYSRGVIQKALNKSFAPEFLNRVDEIITFDQLSLDAIEKIIDIELKGLYERIESLGYKLVIDDKAKTFMASKGYDVQFGARPLKRAIQTYLEDGLSELIISSELQTSDTISVSLNEEKGELDIKKA